MLYCLKFDFDDTDTKNVFPYTICYINAFETVFRGPTFYPVLLKLPSTAPNTNTRQILVFHNKLLLVFSLHISLYECVISYSYQVQNVKLVCSVHWVYWYSHAWSFSHCYAYVSMTDNAKSQRSSRHH